MIQQPEQTKISLTIIDQADRYHSIDCYKHGAWSPQDAIIEAIRFLRQNLKQEAFDYFCKSVAAELEKK